ncbi:hypothetical protein O6H91_12G089100 [Diphasiastrum complanatum]|uniref:Uncharacterized protein n=2 Tax=Diphasiastrum complanatum TaxID=34168 RepID=A0ACC2C4K2_DIPCM|nr:hypothetical protein O6H91_12G088500 [Diphasiastrum complanatum]KAJ7536936.1 hypothetical protein O6H91_12G089100 [Diphasiastrum complanatum]
MCDLVKLYHSSLGHGAFSCDFFKTSPFLDHSMAVRSSYPLRYILRYWLADHPSIASFRWDQNTWGGAWTVPAASVPLYLFVIFFIKLLFSWRKKPIPLGPIPVLHNLLLLLSSIVIFAGCWQAAVVEIQESRWLWGNSRRGLDWLLCFPLGTRPAGRVFFWSYVYYLSKFYELFDTVILVLRKKKLTFLHLFHHAALIIMCFCWLQFTQSLQVLTIITNAGVNAIKYLYLLFHSLGYSPSWKKRVTNCQILQSMLSSVASIGCLMLHLRGGGCAGMGAWIFHFISDITLLLLSLDLYFKQCGEFKEITKEEKKKQI